MRFLAHGYDDKDSTQCNYFSHHLSRMDGVETGIWNGTGGLYNTFDSFKPDVFMVHCRDFDNDLTTFLSDSDTPDLQKLFIVANGSPHQCILDCENKLNKINYDKHTYITNNIKHLDKAPENTLYLPEAADSGLVSIKDFEYNIDTLIVIDRLSDMITMPQGSCHVMSTNPELLGKVDICRPLGRFSPLLKNYRNVSIRISSHDLPQVYFDAILSGCNVTIDSPNAHCSNRLKDVCKRMFDCDCDDTTSVYEEIKKHHLSEHRTQALYELIPANNERYFVT